ncbi:MAG: serine/threonine-protein phosphatase [Clostridiales bacterium]|jgi:hypothetical protein|nr:serine/threonine-protein phosphatase [Clostridiales bacterium]
MSERSAKLCSKLCADIGYRTISHFGEELCGDTIDVAEQGESSVAVLADGLGSGVKACILSTLTSKIISTMIASGMSIEDCVETMAATLPVCSVRGVAYSTFTIIKIDGNRTAEIIQYDNPKVILLRNFNNCEYPIQEVTIGGKRIFKSRISLQINDIFVAISDGCSHAGIGLSYNWGWKREEMIEFLEAVSLGGYTAKTISTILIEEIDRLYGSKPGDDASVCAIHIRERVPVNLLLGPPSNRDDCGRMMSLFFSKEGKKIICGGTTSTIAAKHLNKKLITSLEYVDQDIPPIAQIEGVDLVTEGVITLNKVILHARNYLSNNDRYLDWGLNRDGASLICRLLFEEATDINFFVGRAVNPAHQSPDLPISFSIKMNLVAELSDCLRKMGKRIKVSYF